jgi:hypothetical protein
LKPTTIISDPKYYENEGTRYYFCSYLLTLVVARPAQIDGECQAKLETRVCDSSFLPEEDLIDREYRITDRS